MRPLLPELMKPGRIVDWVMRGNLISIRLDYGDVPVNAHIDSVGNALIEPPQRENLPDVCRTCDQLEHDKSVAIVNSPTYAWRHLGLVEPDGTPTQRGMIFSFFHGGEGLAVAVALESHARRLIPNKDYSQAFDTALDALQSGRGDCTEHAVLLAALAVGERGKEVAAGILKGVEAHHAHVLGAVLLCGCQLVRLGGQRVRLLRGLLDLERTRAALARMTVCVCTTWHRGVWAVRSSVQDVNN